MYRFVCRKTIALKLGIQNPHNKKYLLHTPLLNVPTFPDIMKFFGFLRLVSKKVGII